MKLTTWTLPVLSLVIIGSAAAQSPVAKNKKMAKRYFEEIINQGRLETADELLAVDVRFKNPPVSLSSRTELKELVKNMRAAFPDLTFRVEDVIAEGDKVAVRWIVTGTHLGEIRGQAPSGKKMAVTGMDIFEIRDGRIRQIWVNMDVLGQAQQLGWLPTPPSGSR